MKSFVTSDDMALTGQLYRFVSPAALPVSFCYDGQFYHGVPDCFCPEVEVRMPGATMVQTIIRGRFEDIEIRVEHVEYRDYPGTELLAFFTNRGNTDSARLSDVKIFDGILPYKRASLIHGNGDTLDDTGYEWFTDSLDRPVTLAPEGGLSCEGAFPYMRLQSENFGINLAIGWPAMWQADFEPGEEGVRVRIGQKRCSMVLHPGETMRTPRVNLLGYMGDETRGTNMWRRWYMAHIMPMDYGKPMSPKLCLHVFEADGKPEFTGANEENQLGGIDDYLAQDIHPDIWWLDAGWYPCGNYDWPTIGTWKPNPVNWPNGMTPMGEKCDENGIQLMLWFEPERCRPGTELDEEHSEWLLHLTNEDGTDNINRLVNLGDPDCCNFIIERVDSIIKSSRVRVYRQDFNFRPLPYWQQHETEDRIGAMENLHAQGYLRFWDTLRLRNPGLWIDSCASGGRRNDLETMRRAVTLHYTDVGYGNHPIKQKQHWQMFAWIPYFRAHNMNWDLPDGSYGSGNHGPDQFAYYCAMTPSLTDMIKHDASDEAFELARKMHPIWRKAAALMLSGDYYPLTVCRKSAEDYYAVQFHDENTGKGFVEVIRNTRCEKPSFCARLKALNNDAVYLLTEAESGETVAYTGAALREGLEVTLPVRSGRIYFYERKNEYAE